MRSVREAFTRYELQQVRDWVREREHPADRFMMTRLLWEIWRLHEVLYQAGEYALVFPERMRDHPSGDKLLQMLRKQVIIRDRYPDIMLDPAPPRSEWSREDKRRAREDRG